MVKRFLKKLFIILYSSIITLIITSCSEDPKLLMQNGKFEQAMKVYKKQLSNDYNNSSIRKEITFAYFDKALLDISNKDIFNAKKNIEKGVIYFDEDDTTTLKKYSSILCELGQLCVEIGLSSKNDKFDIKKSKLYEKGISYIKKSVELDKENSIAKEILIKLNEEKANSFFEIGKEYYNKWFQNQEVEKYIFNSRKNLLRAKELNYGKVKEANILLEKIKENLVQIASRNDLYSFKITDILHNRQTNLLAINLRFYNNEKQGYRAVDPKQFTLYDSYGNKYKPNLDIDKLTGYKNLMSRRRLDANRSFKGLLVFNLGKKRIKIFNKLVWVSSKGEIAKKEFPNKSITKIKLD